MTLNERGERMQFHHERCLTCVYRRAAVLAHQAHQSECSRYAYHDSARNGADRRWWHNCCVVGSFRNVLDLNHYWVDISTADNCRTLSDEFCPGYRRADA